MMAASAIENGSRVKLGSSPNSVQNASLHDPADEPNPASPTTAGHADGDPSDELEEARSYSSTKLQRSFSSAGKQLAESSSTLGPKADRLPSEHPSELSVSNSSTYSEDSLPPLIGDEATIALSQLQDLEVAIKVRKVTKIDGRKTRWAVHQKLGHRHRRRKAAKCNSEPITTPVINSDKELNEQDNVKPAVQVPKKSCSVKSKFHVKQLKSFTRNKSKPDLSITAESSQYLEDTADADLSTNNNSTIASNNNSEAVTDNMKGEDTGRVLGPIETNNVLETMKQQFLEGTCNISGSNPDAGIAETATSTPKEKKKKKLKPGEKLNCLNDENIKRKRGRPKKIRKTMFTSTPKPECAPPIDMDSPVLNNNPENDPFTPLGVETVTPKKENHTSLPLSPELYLRKNPVTRGLREVRKSESGSESNSSTPVKDTSLHLQLSPGSPSLSLTPSTLTTPNKYENTNGNSKLPLIKAAAKALFNYEHEQQSNGPKRKKYLRKFPRNKKGLLLNNNESCRTTQSEGEDCASGRVGAAKPMTKVGRGRKRTSLPNAWPKKTSMVVAEVHNSMNGEPQAVIKPPSVGRKKKSVEPKTKKNNTETTITAGAAVGKSLNHSSWFNWSAEELGNSNEKSVTPVVPSLKSPQGNSSVSATSACDVNTPENVASKSANSGINIHNDKSEDRDDSQVNNDTPHLELTSTEKIDADQIADSNGLRENSSHSFKNTTAAVKNTTLEKKRKPIVDSTSNNIVVPDKKQKSILDYTTNMFAKGKTTFNTLTKSLKLSPKSKSLPTDATPNVSLLSDASVKHNLTNGSDTLNETRMSVEESSTPDVLASPRKPLSSFSPDKQRKEKGPKNKSLHAVIEKLHKPSKVDEVAEQETPSCYPDPAETAAKDANLNLPTPPEESSKDGDDLLLIAENGAKDKKKHPRFLMELFKDEGVKVLLNSLPANADGIRSLQASIQHKLRPKRANDHYSSESPEPGEAFPKRKKRHTEVDNLFVDEGTLNLLTSIENSNRRQSFYEELAENLKGIGTVAKHTSLRVLEGKKRKFSGGSLRPGQQPSDSKRLKLSMDILKPSVHSGGVVKKKPGRPSKADVLKRQQLGGTVNGQPQRPKPLLPKPTVVDSKSVVPPLKIRLTPSETTGTMRPSISQAIKSHISPVNGKSATFLQGANPKTMNYDVAGRKPISSNGQTLVHGVPIKKLLPAGALKTMKIGLIKPLNRGTSRAGDEKVNSKVEILRQSQRASVRNEASNHFRDIHLRKFNHFMHIIFNPSTTKMKNAFNSKVLRELCEALNYIKKDSTVNLVLLTGTGSTFCQGIDLTSLQHSNIEVRKKNATNLTRAIKEFLHCLISFPKMIVAGINGNATGLGVTMLPLFDLVIASDKAEFSLPYGELGQVPEGGATYTFPQNYGKLQSNNLFMGKRITASQAQSMGMVSETLWPATFIQELIPKVAGIANHPSAGLEATKALMNHHLMTKLELSVETECRALLQQWGTPTFAAQCKRYLDSKYILFQVPAFRQNQ